MYDHDEITMSAFHNELEKIGGLGKFLIKGIRGWQSTIGRAGASAGKRQLTLSKHKDLVKKLYTRGAKDGGGVWGGVKGVARSPYGAMAGTAAIGGAAAYGGYKAVAGNQRPQGYQR